MNKRIAAFLFAVGIGMASAPTIAANCYYYCIQSWKACLASGTPQAECNDELDACQLDC